MLKTPHGPNSNAARAPWSLVMFSVGGRRLAAKVEEVGGVWPWTELSRFLAGRRSSTRSCVEARM